MIMILTMIMIMTMKINKKNFFLIYKNELLLVSQTRNLTKSKKNILKKELLSIIYKTARDRYRNFSEEKNKIKEYQRKRYQEFIQYKKEALKNKLFCLSII